MTNTVNTVGLYVRDQDEALAFYVGTLGFEVHTDVRNGSYRWLTVRSPGQVGFQLGLFVPGPPAHDAATARRCSSWSPRGDAAAGTRSGGLPRATRNGRQGRRVHPGTG